MADIQLDARPFTPCPWYVEVNDLPAGAYRTVMNEVLQTKGLHTWEVMEKGPACCNQGVGGGNSRARTGHGFALDSVKEKPATRGLF